MKTTGPIFAALLTACSVSLAGDRGSPGMVLTADAIEWVPSSRVPGLGLAKIDGDAKKHGAYVYRVRFPPGRVIRAHCHPDDRSLTVLSGTWYIGWGDTYDPARLTVLPAGSFYTEPAGVSHFGATPDGEVEIQVSGSGPTAVYYVEPALARSE